MISITVDDDLLDGIENFIAARNEPPRGKMSMDDAVNVMIKDWLMSQGYIMIPDEPNTDDQLKAADQRTEIDC